MDLFEEVKFTFKQGSLLIKLIYINIAFFLLVNCIYIFFFLFNEGDLYKDIMRSWLFVPSSLKMLIFRPWTLFTYMFLHFDLMHILFNMLLLFWFGRIFLEYLGERQLLTIYVLGGLLGAFMYILFFNIFPVFEIAREHSAALGASASVLAVVIAISVFVPNYEILVMFIGKVKLKYVAAISVVVDFISIGSTNAGGHIAHLGGALFGYLFIIQYRKGVDWSRHFNKIYNLITSIFNRKKMKVTHSNVKKMDDWEYNKNKRTEQEEMDKILDKISKHGYDKLTSDEKAKLFKMSGK